MPNTTRSRRLHPYTPIDMNAPPRRRRSRWPVLALLFLLALAAAFGPSLAHADEMPRTEVIYATPF